MSLLGGASGGSDRELDLNRQPVTGYVQERRAVRSDRLCGGTLACDRCDAPLALGAEPISLAQTLSCPFCQRRAPARDFLSLASPTRPARVAVRVSRPARRAGQRLTPTAPPAAGPARAPRPGGWAD